MTPGQRSTSGLKSDVDPIKTLPRAEVIERGPSRHGNKDRVDQHCMIGQADSRPALPNRPGRHLTSKERADHFSLIAN
ncbi:hypothetical protein BHE74_00029191 [Ensete ventricosum]|nr:hypothetical protein BHE74_00029191 [Ensete ventricosum]